jgi:hypothetical protein
VVAVRDELAAPAERLRDPTPVPVETVALAAALLQESTGPLYGPRAVQAADGPLIRRLAAQSARSRRPARRFRRVA